MQYFMAVAVTTTTLGVLHSAAWATGPKSRPAASPTQSGEVRSRSGCGIAIFIPPGPKAGNGGIIVLALLGPRGDDRSGGEEGRNLRCNVRPFLEVVVAENVVVAMGAEGTGIAASHLGHDRLALRRGRQAEDGAGKLERLLHRPDALVLGGREDLRGIAY